MVKYRLIETPEGKYRVQKLSVSGWEGLEPKCRWSKFIGVQGEWTLESLQRNYCDFTSYDKAYHFYKMLTEDKGEPRVLMETEE